VRAVVYDGPGDFSIRTIADPEPGPGQVVLDVEIAGMCGTDLHIHEGGFYAAYPLVPGHEIVGRVARLGDGVEDVAIGQRVAADNTIVCGHCAYCQRDQPLYCRNLYSLGVNRPGGFAEQVVVGADKCFDAGDLELGTAVVTEPLACVVHGMDVLDLRPGSDVVVLGAGPTGLLLAQSLVHGGAARVTVAAPTAFKLDLARGLGVDETVLLDRDDPAAGLERLRALRPDGFDVAIDATGAPELITGCVALVRDGGTVLVYGMAGEVARVEISPYEIFRRELTVKGSFAQTHCFDRSLALLRSGRVRAEGIVTHTFALGDFAAALEAVRSDPSCLKAAIVPDL
jgi:D-arabinitol dehydrogenase (NADP+)